MAITESDIAYEHGDYWVLRLPTGGYEVYQVGICASTRVASIGYKGDEGLQRSIAEIGRRERDQ